MTDIPLEDMTPVRVMEMESKIAESVAPIETLMEELRGSNISNEELAVAVISMLLKPADACALCGVNKTRLYSIVNRVKRSVPDWSQLKRRVATLMAERGAMRALHAYDPDVVAQLKPEVLPRNAAQLLDVARVLSGLDKEKDMNGEQVTELFTRLQDAQDADVIAEEVEED